MSSSDSPWTVVEDQVMMMKDDDDDGDDEFADAFEDAHDEEEEQQQQSSSVSTPTINGGYESANDKEDVGNEKPFSIGGIAELSTTTTSNNLLLDSPPQPAPPSLQNHQEPAEPLEAFGALGDAVETETCLDVGPQQQSTFPEDSLGALAPQQQSTLPEDSLGALFGEAERAPAETVDVALQQQQHNDAEGEDSFGAFGEVEPAPAETVDVAPRQQQKHNDAEGEDSFGAFGEAMELYAVDLAPPQQSPVEEDVSFGTFDEAEALDVAAQQPETIGEDSFGAYGEVPPAEPDTLDEAPQPSEAVMAEDDSFGKDAVPYLSDTSPQPSEAVVDEDSFGAFGEAEVAETLHVAPQPTDAERENLFGAAKPAVADTSLGLAPQQSEAEKEDSFGAFGEAEQGTAIRISPAVKPAEAIESCTVENNHDSFGAFDEATHLPVTVSPLSEPNGKTSENLGAALANDTEIIKTQTNAGADDPANEVDDDFGDFAVADPDTEDDDFGDFGAAPSNDQAIQEDAGQEEEDDDFGDFEVSKSTVPSPTPVNVSDVDPIMQRAQSAFPDLFGRYKPADNSGSSSIRSECETDSVSVQDVLSSLDAESKVDEVPCVDASQLLNKQFEDESMFKKASSRIIYSGSGGPFGYLRYPVGGIRPLETSWKTAPDEHLLRIAPNQLIDTEVIPVPLVATKSSIETSRAISELPPTNSSTAAKSFVNGNSSTHSDTPSEKVKEFLSRVPDLSYMLSSKLSLPTDK